MNLKYTLSFLSFLCIVVTMSAQETTEELPFYQIPDYPEEYTPGNINARYIQGLGYRYYWATEGLTEENLDYRPSQDARNLMETLEHLYGLSDMILNGTLNKENIRPLDTNSFNYETLRKATLVNLEKASKQLSNKSVKEIKKLKIIFGNGDNRREIPFWNMLNGPISDAIYHTGQVVTMRRASGNPMNPKVNVFMGKTGQ